MTFHKGSVELPTLCKRFLQMNQLFSLKSLQKYVKYTNDWNGYLVCKLVQKMKIILSFFSPSLVGKEQ